jgi:sulfur-oxidizing protein SoxX
MKTRRVLVFLIASLVAVSGCDRDAMMSQRGFRLPDGDAQAGQEAFLYMQCNQCHTIAGMELPVVAGEEPPYVELGGSVSQVKTYGDLLTAIIYPSHDLVGGYTAELVSEDGESDMYVYNEHMTVKELIDIVTFLQPQYDVIVPKYYDRRHR